MSQLYCFVWCILYFLYQDQDKEELLDGLIARNLSFSEAEKSIEELKALGATKEVFLKETGFGSWPEAQAKVPMYASDSELKKFKVQKGKALPKPFSVSYMIKQLHMLFA